MFRFMVRKRHLTGVLSALIALGFGLTQLGIVTPVAQAAPAPDTYFSVADMRNHRPFYISHRGGSDDWPEMSMAAYANSSTWGMGALEVSVARTGDGRSFGLHDATLDRTSLVSGDINPSTMTWAYLTANFRNKLNSASPAGDPYATVADIFSAYAANHVMFVDMKYIGDVQQRTDLIKLMLSYAPADHWVLKGYNTDTALADLARCAGIQSWGYYYSADMAGLDATAPYWDMLGLELNASGADWARMKSLGKPVVAFFASNQADLTNALSKGADGIMVSSVPGVFGSPRYEANDHETLQVTPPPTQAQCAQAAGQGSAAAGGATSGAQPSIAHSGVLPAATNCKTFKPRVRGKKVRVTICIRGNWTKAKIKKAKKKAAKRALARLR